jgi:hypothetical protein
LAADSRSAGVDRPPKLLHIGVGPVHAGVRVVLLVNELDVRVITETANYSGI